MNAISSSLQHARALCQAGKWQEAADRCATALEKTPADPRLHFLYADCLIGLGRCADAIGHYEKAIELKPDYLQAMTSLAAELGRMGLHDRERFWLSRALEGFQAILMRAPGDCLTLNNMGNVLRRLGRIEEARVCHLDAIRINPGIADFYVNLAADLRDLGRAAEAIEACRKALLYQPDSVDARHNLGALFQDVRRYDEAIALFEGILEEHPENSDAKWNSALCLLALGRYEEGWRLYECGLGFAHFRGKYPLPRRRWNGEGVTGKRLLIWTEQGLGDALHFVRYAALCKQRGAHIILLCHPPLQRLFSHCPFVDEVPPRPEKIGEEDFDVHVPLMSLPYIFGTRLDTIPAAIPYLFVSEATRSGWAGKFVESLNLKVGLVWAGSPREHMIDAHMIDRRRSMSLAWLKPLFDVPGVQFYNLQMGDKAAQIDDCGLRSRFVDLMGEVQDFEDTGAIIERLDLVISVDTSVVHLTGGLGKPIWVMSRFDACWRWLQNRPDTPWYPTARIFGQHQYGDWSGVVQDIVNALEEEVGKRTDKKVPQ